MAVRLPSDTVFRYGFIEGRLIDFIQTETSIVLKPKKQRKITLKKIIDSIDPNDPPEYVDWGPPVGKEIW